MLPRNFISPALFFLILLLLSRCANPVSPQGGPKDTTPPKVERCTPPNFSTHFSSKEIDITFAEFVQLKDAQTQVTISPPYLPKTEYRVRGKSLVVHLEDSLRSNTTYSLYFGDAISDITENNVLKNFSYVFSTGDYIDSLGIEGTVTDAFTLKRVPSVWASLYTDNNDTLPLDSLPLHVSPLYRTRTDENGHFLFHNIKEGRYLLFSVKDLNGNTYFDQPTETIAFYDSLVSSIYIAPRKADTSHRDTLARQDTLARSDSIRRADSVALLKPANPVYALMMFTPQDSVQRLMKKSLLTDQEIQLIFKYPLRSPGFEPLKFIPEGHWLMEEFTPRMDTAILWLLSYSYDSIELKITDQGRIVDTVSFDVAMKKEKKKTTKTGDVIRPKLSFLTYPPDARLNAYRYNPYILSPVPLEKYDLSRGKLVSGKDTISARLQFADSIRRKIILSYKWKEDAKYELIIPDSVFTGIDGRSNDSIRFTFRTRPERDFGSIKMKLNGTIEKGDLILQLLGNNDVVTEERIVTSPGDVRFNYLLPGSFRFRLVFDVNANKKWDTGDYRKKIQPEKILYFSKTIEVRGNWDIDETWDF